VTRAIEPEDVNVPRPAGVTIMPIPTIAAIAITAAATRQNVSLRRNRRRSTITSESSDIEVLLQQTGAHRQQHDPVMKLHQFKHNLKKTRLPVAACSERRGQQKGPGRNRGLNEDMEKISLTFRRDS
jgi:hypothetical protein